VNKALQALFQTHASLATYLTDKALAQYGSREFVGMFHFEADHPYHLSEAASISENVGNWLEFFEQTMYEDMLMKGKAVKADKLKIQTRDALEAGDSKGIGLLSSATDTPFYDALNTVVNGHSTTKTTQIQVSGKTIPLVRYIPTTTAHLVSKAGELKTTFAKSFPVIYEKIAEVVINFETPADVCIAAGNCIKADEFSPATYKEPKLLNLITLLQGTGSILEAHHAFAYHDLYHAMTFGRSMGLQMDLAGIDCGTAYESYAWIGYVVGLYHDMGYPILNQALGTDGMVTTLPHIMTKNLLVSGKFGNLHELASLAYLLEKVFIVNSLAGEEQYVITVEERVIMAYGILASKIGNAGTHLSALQVGSTINRAFDQVLTDDMFGWIMMPITKAQGKGLHRGAPAKKAFDEAKQFYLLVTYALTLIFHPKRVFSIDIETTSKKNYDAAVEVATHWVPKMQSYESYFEA